MKRLLYSQLQNWKNASRKLPLILRGARQVGKSYLLKAFGKNEFSKCHNFDFDRDKTKLSPLFEGSLNPKEIILNLSVIINQKIDIKNDLIIFDEIQSCPNALNSLKYFCEDLPTLSICAAGSLLGITFCETSFPVGKVCYLDLYPLNFEEFLMNSNKELLYKAFLDSKKAPLIHQELMHSLKEYYVVGGMPSVLLEYFGSKDKANGFKKARIVQKNLLDSYINDISKHSGKINALHINSVFQNIPIQLVADIDGSVKRYKFKDVVPKKNKFTDLQGPIDWLVKAGLAIKVSISEKSQIPLKSFCKDNIFKLYIFDTGLLGAMLELSIHSIFNEDYGLIKGFFTENFVANELVASGECSLYSWTERNSEIEFLMDIEGKLVPIEVKSGTRTKAKSLAQYLKKYEPKTAVILSANPAKPKNNTIRYYPLYYASKLRSLLTDSKDF